MVRRMLYIDCGMIPCPGAARDMAPPLVWRLAALVPRQMYVKSDDDYAGDMFSTTMTKYAQKPILSPAFPRPSTAQVNSESIEFTLFKILTAPSPVEDTFYVHPPAPVC